MNNNCWILFCVLIIISDISLAKADLEYMFQDYDFLASTTENVDVEGSCSVINLTAVSESPTSIFVKWEPPDSTSCVNFDSLTNYEVEWYGGNISGNPSSFTTDTNYTITDLSLCERYSITVTPCFGAIPSTSDSSSVYETTTTTAPNAPGMQSCIATSSSEIEVTWAESNSTNDLCGGNLFYDIYVEGYSLWDEFTEISSSNTTDTSVILSDLHPYTSYTIFVSANNDGGTSENVTCGDILTLEEAPGPPENVTVTAESSSSLLVTWNPPQDVPGVILQYWVNVSTDFNENVKETTETSLSIDKLNECTAYIVTVTAETGGGNGTSSPDVDAITMGQLNYSEPLCMELGSTIEVSWTYSPTSCETSEPLVVSWDGIILWADPPSNEISGFDETNETSYVISDDFYYYSIYNIIITSGANESTHESCTNLTTKQAAPGPPENVLANPVSTSSLLVSWSSPLLVNGILLQYMIHVSDELNGTVAEESTTNTSLVIDTLAECTKYSVKVVAETGGGLGNFSEPLESTTLGQLNFSEPFCTESGSTIEVSWTYYPSSCETSESLVVSWDGIILWADPPSNNISGFDEANATPYVISDDFYHYSNYNITITSGGKEFTHESCTNLTTKQAAPGPPENVSANPVSTSSLLISWSSPLLVNGILVQYMIHVSDELNGLIAAENTTNTSLVIDTLTECTKYSVEVVAETGGGVGNFSDPLDSTTLGNLHFSDLECSESSDSESVDVTWAIYANASCNSSDTLNVSWNGTILWKDSPDRKIEGSGEATGTYYNIQEFYYYTTYLITVSSRENSMMHKSCPDLTTSQAKPTEPSDVKVNATTSNSISLQWFPPLEINGELSGYEISWNDVTEEVNGDVTFYIASGLNENTNYSFAILAITDNGKNKGPPTSIIGLTDVDQNRGGGSLGAGAIVGIVLGAIIVVALVGFIVIKSDFLKKDSESEISITSAADRNNFYNNGRSQKVNTKAQPEIIADNNWTEDSLYGTTSQPDPYDGNINFESDIESTNI